MDLLNGTRRHIAVLSQTTSLVKINGFLFIQFDKGKKIIPINGHEKRRIEKAIKNKVF